MQYANIDDGTSFGSDDVGSHAAIDRPDVDRDAALQVVEREQPLDDHVVQIAGDPLVVDDLAYALDDARDGVARQDPEVDHRPCLLGKDVGLHPAGHHRHGGESATSCTASRSAGA